MRTDDNLTAALSSRLRAEVAGIEPSPDLLATLRARRDRRSRATRAGLAAAVPLAAAVASLALLVPGAGQPGKSAASAGGAAPLATGRRPSPVRTIRLDGYVLSVPPGFGAAPETGKLGAGVELTSAAMGTITISLVGGAAPPADAAPISVGTVHGLASTGPGGGRIWLPFPVEHGTRALVIEVRGMAVRKAARILAGSIGQWKPVPSTCSVNCG